MTLDITGFFYLLLIVSGGLATGQTVLGQNNFLDLYLGEIYSEKGTSNQHIQALDVQTAIHQPVRLNESETAKFVPSNFAAGATLEETTCKAPHEEARISPVKRRLWKDRISIYTHEDNTASKDELHKIIEQIRAIKFEPSNKTAEDADVTEQTSVAETIEPKEVISESKALPDPNNKKQKAKRQPPLPDGIITDQTLQIIRDLCQDPCQVENPFELAEIMFQSDYLREAPSFTGRRLPVKPRSRLEFTRKRLGFCSKSVTAYEMRTGPQQKRCTNS